MSYLITKETEKDISHLIAIGFLHCMIEDTLETYREDSFTNNDEIVEFLGVDFDTEKSIESAILAICQSFPKNLNYLVENFERLNTWDKFGAYLYLDLAGHGVGLWEFSRELSDAIRALWAGKEIFVISAYVCDNGFIYLESMPNIGAN